jgi:hypothetical protein
MNRLLDFGTASKEAAESASKKEPRRAAAAK